MGTQPRSKVSPVLMPPVQLERQFEEQIRTRAYGLYERGRVEGHELDDWLQAEIDILRQRKAVA